MLEAMTVPSEAPAVPAAPQWDPFQLMDRMDEEALRREVERFVAVALEAARTVSDRSADIRYDE